MEIERQRDRHNRVVQEIAAAGRQNRGVLAGGAVTYATGCTAFTSSLRRVVWPVKFKPDLPRATTAGPTLWSSYSSTPSPSKLQEATTR